MYTHKSLELLDRKENDTASLVTNSNVPNHDYRCPVCNEAVEIMYNDVNLSLKVHAIRHRASSDKLEDNHSNCSGKSKNSSKKNTAKTLQIAADKLSNSGSGKSKESFKIVNQVSSNSSTGERSILDDIFNAMPTSLKAHRGFMERNSDGKTTCKVCNLMIENTSHIPEHLETKLCNFWIEYMFNISEHLQTKSHEDNVITFLKSFVCEDRLYELDFVSVYGSKLSCNLCKCRIYISSKNPHETVVNILNHNSSKSHIKNKSSDVKDSSDARLLLQSLSQLNPAFFDENKQYVSVEMQPKITCYLCNEQIIYDSDLNQLLKNVIAHFNGAVHAKSANTLLILKIFKKLNIPGIENHNLTLKEGNIHCTICACIVEPGLQTLEKHVKMSNSEQFGKDENNGYSINKNVDKVQTMHSTKFQNVATNKNKLDVKSFLRSMPTRFHNIDYIAQKEGQLFCLLCNCGIPPSNKHLKDHLTDSKHKKNEESEPERNKIIVPESLVASSPVDSSRLVGIEPVPQDLEKRVKMTISNQSVQNDNNGHSLPKHYNKAQEFRSTSTENVATDKNYQDVKMFLRSMPAQFRTIDYIAQKEGQLFCLLCNCGVPPSSKNLKEHLTGGKHKKNEEANINNKVIPETLVAFSPLDSSRLVGVEPVPQDLDKRAKITISNQYRENENNGLSFYKEYNNSLELLSTSTENVATDKNELDVKSFLRSMPAQFRNIDYIVQKEGKLFCLLCNCGIPPANKNLEEHLTGSKHKNEEAKINEQIIPETLVASSPVDSSGLVEKLAEVSMVCNPRQDMMLKELTKSGILVKSNSKYIAKEGENYICTLCSSLIKQSSDSEVLKDNFSNHFNGKKHNKLLDQHQQVKDLLDKLVASNSVIQTEKAFLKVQNRLVHCTLCSSSILYSITSQSLEMMITDHVSGNKHKSKKNEVTVNSPEVLPETSNLTIKPRSFNVSSNPFMASIQSADDQYSYARLGHSLLMPPQPLIPLIPHPPLLKQPTLPVCDTRIGWNLVTHSFKDLPYYLQVESKFIKNGSIDGFLECTLCNCTINPYYLQEHLREARHLREKFTFEDKTARFMQSRK